MAAQRIRVLAAAYAAVPGSSPHGASMFSLIDGLRAELDLVTLKTEDLPHIKRIADARMFRVPVAKAREDEKRNLYMRAVARQLDAEPYHVVHVFDPWAGSVAAKHARRRSSAVLVYEVATFPAQADEAAWLEAHRETVEAANRMIVSNVATRDALGLDKVDVVRPGVDVGGFDYGHAQHLGNPRLLYLGTAEERRDLDTVLEAIEKVVAVRPVRVLLAGEPDGSRREALRHKVRQRGLTEVVTVRGPPKQHQLPGIIAAADVCLAPSVEQKLDGCSPLPEPLLEYMACGRPVVVADVQGVTEIVRDEVEGLIYPASNASALADALLEVLRDSTLRERVAGAAYRRVRDELGAGARRRRVREVYEAMVPDSQSHDPWDEGFEEPTGLIELSDSQIEVLQDDAPKTVRPPETDTAEHVDPPAVAPEPTRPRAMLGRPSDTHPGLVVPDTDPGRS